MNSCEMINHLLEKRVRSTRTIRGKCWKIWIWSHTKNDRKRGYGIIYFIYVLEWECPSFITRCIFHFLSHFLGLIALKKILTKQIYIYIHIICWYTLGIHIHNQGNSIIYHWITAGTATTNTHKSHESYHTQIDDDKLAFCSTVTNWMPWLCSHNLRLLCLLFLSPRPSPRLLHYQRTLMSIIQSYYY